MTQPNSQQIDQELIHVEHELKNMISQAKHLINNVKIPTELEETQFHTTASGELIFPDFNHQVNYSEQFWKTYLKNQMSFSLIKQLSQQTSSLQSLMHNIQEKQQQFFKAYKLKNRKKNRRLAVQIEKKFTCPYEKCYKIYGSDVSLNLHIKLKHNGGNKTDREKLAEAICYAEVNHKPMPKLSLQLPPGYLEEYRNNQFKKIIQSGILDNKIEG